MSTTVDSPYEDDSIDLRALLARLWANRGSVSACVALFFVAFWAVAFLMTPIYRATVLLMPTAPERSNSGNSVSSALGQLGGLASIAGIGLASADSETQESLAVLQSRQFTESFIADNNLMPELFATDWDLGAGKWKSGLRTPPTPARAFRYFDKKIRTVAQDKKTGLVTVQIDWKNRNEAAAWANELVQRLNSEMRSRAITQADTSVGFLQKELADTSDIGTREAINRLIEGQVKQRMLANVTQEYAFRVVDKAMPPDSDDPERPQKLLLLAIGPLVGLLIGLAYALAFGANPRKAI